MLIDICIYRTTALRCTLIDIKELDAFYETFNLKRELLKSYIYARIRAGQQTNAVILKTQDHEFCPCASKDLEFIADAQHTCTCASRCQHQKCKNTPYPMSFYRVWVRPYSWSSWHKSHISKKIDGLSASGRFDCSSEASVRSVAHHFLH